MTIPDQSTLNSLETRSTDIVNLARQYDADSQATLSAKRRFFLVELDVAGLSPDNSTAAQIAEISAQGYPNLTKLLKAFHCINDYSRSSDRLKWNPEAEPGRTNVPICLDWFIASIIPEELNNFDFLSRCERIWSDSDPVGGGVLFTRIFNYRIKFVTGYEDGMRLVLCRVEVGEKSNVPKVTRLSKYSVKPVDLMRRMGTYDASLDVDDWYVPIKVPMGISRWDFTLAEIDRQDFKQLKDLLGEVNFQTIVDAQGYLNPQNEFSSYRGDDDLAMRYYIRKTDQLNISELILVGFGEMQPGRWIANIEGLWHITEEPDPEPENSPAEVNSIAPSGVIPPPSPWLQYSIRQAELVFEFLLPQRFSWGQFGNICCMNFSI